jgi:transposase-like protein
MTAACKPDARVRHWKWHLDEMYVKLNDEMAYLWRAVDHEGEVLESYVTENATNLRLCAS